MRVLRSCICFKSANNRFFCRLKSLTQRWVQKIDPMQHSLHTNTVRDEFIAPISELLPQCKNRRECRHLSDQVWLEMGVERVLGQQRSGRGFLQDWAMTEASAVRVSSFSSHSKVNVDSRWSKNSIRPWLFQCLPIGTA